jgi:hypothetical protein
LAARLRQEGNARDQAERKRDTDDQNSPAKTNAFHNDDPLLQLRSSSFSLFTDAGNPKVELLTVFPTEAGRIRW